MNGNDKNCGGSCCGGNSPLTDKSDRQFTIALLGQPNTGKSTIFNKLTGSTQHVGNWPGKTVTKKEGYFIHADQKYYIYDLPGTYSLTSNSLEEVISRDFILQESPDLVVVVIDSSQLRRSLYILAEALLLGSPVLAALNKADMLPPAEAEKTARKIQNAGGFPVVPLEAAGKNGVKNLMEAIAVSAGKSSAPGCRPDPEKHFGKHFTQLTSLIRDICPDGYTPEWTAVKILEGDSKTADILRTHTGSEVWQKISDLKSSADKGAIKGAGMRYEWISSILKDAPAQTETVRTSLFDSFALHPLWGNITAVFALLAGMTAVYIVSIPLIIPGMGLLFAAKPIREMMAPVFPPWMIELLADGVLGGLAVGFIIMGFVASVYFVLGIFENTGYLARLAYLFDPLMKRVGLHGKSVMPLIMGVVCNILGVAGSRVIDTWQQRLVTLLIVPIIPCKGLIVVLAFVTAILFGAKALLVYLALFAVMLVYIFITSYVLRRFFIKGERSGLIMELPPYNKPVWRDIILYTLSSVKAFYHRGFKFIVLISFICWAGIYYPHGSINTSYLAAAGRFMEPLGNLMGLDWRLFLSYLIAFSSKEAALPVMAVIFGAGSVPGGTNLYELSLDVSPFEIFTGSFGSFLASAGISQASALAFVFAVTFSLPCLSTLGVIYSETRSYKWTFSILVYYFLVSVAMGAAAYRAGLFLL